MPHHRVQFQHRRRQPSKGSVQHPMQDTPRPSNPPLVISRILNPAPTSRTAATVSTSSLSEISDTSETSSTYCLSPPASLLLECVDEPAIDASTFSQRLRRTQAIQPQNWQQWLVTLFAGRRRKAARPSTPESSCSANSFNPFHNRGNISIHNNASAFPMPPFDNFYNNNNDIATSPTISPQQPKKLLPHASHEVVRPLPPALAQVLPYVEIPTGYNRFAGNAMVEPSNFEAEVVQRGFEAPGNGGVMGKRRHNSILNLGGDTWSKYLAKNGRG